MAANVGFLPIDTIIDDYIEDRNLDQELINYEQLKRWAVDCAHWITFSQQLRTRIGLFITNEHGKVELPDEYRHIQQVAYRIPKSKKDCTTSEGIKQWIQKDYNSGLELEINVKCPKCYKEKCNCDSRAIIFDVDQIWLHQNMEGTISDKAVRYRFGRGQKHQSELSDELRDQFKIMRHSIADFRNNVMDGCNEFNFRCGDYQYEIDHPYIATDLPKGAEVLVSYLAIDTDDDGNIQIPSVPDALDSIIFHLDHKRFQSMYAQTLEQKYLQAAREFKFERERSIELARSELQMPEFQELFTLMNQVFYTRINGDSRKLEESHYTVSEMEDRYLSC